MAARGHFPPTHCPSSAAGSRWDSRTSRLVSIHRVLASNGTDPSPMGKILHRQGQSRVFVAQPLRKKERRKKTYIPGRSSRRPTTAPAICYPDSVSSGTASTRLIARQSTPLLPVSPASPHEQDSSPEPVGKQLYSAKQSNQLATTHQMPLRETQGPQQVNKDGSVQPGSSILYCQPFSTTDLLN